MEQKKQRKFLLLLTIIAVSVVAIAGIGLLIVLLIPPAETDRIYAHIYIHGVPVGGMTAEEANAALMERFQPILESRKINYTINGQVVAEFTFAHFGMKFDFTELVNSAMEFSSLRNLPMRISRLMGRPHEVTDAARHSHSPERMEEIMRQLSAKFDQQPVNAFFSQEVMHGQITVRRETAGHGINIEEAVRMTRIALDSLLDSQIALNIQPITPRYTEANFRFTYSLLGYYETEYVGTEADPRVRNIRRAASKIHNQVLYPGEVFSAGRIIGANLPDSGYEAAIVLVRGEPVEDIGGGVCQVVTTLYNAVLRAELEIVQRHNHSARVSYTELGFDATIAGDYFDLKFKNNTEYPLLIVSYLREGALYVGIIGYEHRAAGRTLRFVAHRVEIIAPEPYREVVDPTVPRGERLITLESQMGYHIELYKYVYMNGEEIERVKINTSIYKPLQGVIAIGAG